MDVLVELVFDILEAVDTQRGFRLRLGGDGLAGREGADKHRVARPDVQGVGQVVAGRRHLSVADHVVVHELAPLWDHALQRHLRIRVVVGVADARTRQSREEPLLLLIGEVRLLLHHHKVRELVHAETVHVLDQEVVPILHFDLDHAGFGEG